MRGARQLYAFLTREHWLVGASLVRVGFGAWAVYFYLLHLPVRRELWGPYGLWPHEAFLAGRTLPSVYQVSPAPWFFEAAYLFGLAVAVLFTLGWRARLLGVLHAVMIISLQERNSLITDGGDNFMRLVLLFLILVDTGAHFSLDAARAVRGGRAGLLQPARAVAHNLGVLLIVVQLCLLYLSTGLYKTMGTVWQNGTALYYVLRVQEFSMPGLADFIARRPVLVVLGTYGTVLFELMFAPLLLRRGTRYAMALAGAAFHGGIGLTMGLLTFSWSILGAYPLLFTDEEYWALRRRVRARLGLVVFYDGWCPVCTRSIRRLRGADLFSLVQFASFRDAPAARFGIDPQRAERRIQSVGASGGVAEGMDALLQIALRSPLLWPLLAVLALGRWAVGQRLYDALASRRVVVPPGTCAAHCRWEERSG